MFCGSCMHDNSLAAALMRLGWDVQLIPTYTPIRTDEENVSQNRVFFGGLNVYLQQKMPLFRYLPRTLDRWLDSPWLINLLASRGIRTDAAQLGELTLSMLRGTDGYQRKEIFRLRDWLRQTAKPDLLLLTNVLIAACVPELKAHLHVPVVVTLQGDDLFLEGLPAPYKEQAFQEIRRIIEHVDGFLVHSEYYADFMRDYLSIPAEKLSVVPIGLRATEFQSLPTRELATPATVGYLARICPAKGFHLLVEAFLRLRREPGMEQVRLKAAGWLGKDDQEYYERERDKIHAAGAEDHFEYVGVIDRPQKIDFLSSIDVLSVPTTYQEPKGIYVLEALAAGIPVVQPEHGAFPELLRATQGGHLFEPHNVADLRDKLAEVLRNAEQHQVFAEAGKRAVLEQFNDLEAARRTMDVLRSFLAKPASAVHGDGQASGQMRAADQRSPA